MFVKVKNVIKEDYIINTDSIEMIGPVNYSEIPSNIRPRISSSANKYSYIRMHSGYTVYMYKKDTDKLIDTYLIADKNSSTADSSKIEEIICG